MGRYFLIISALFALFFSCADGETNGVTNTAVNNGQKNQVKDIIRNPVSAKDPIDTVNVAQFEWVEETFNFGTVKEGKVVEHGYKFKNVGKIPLLIKDARSTCGCTVPEWSEDPIPPGGEGVIQVKFNTLGKTDDQTKPITITANTYPSRTLLRIEGFVIKMYNK